MEAEYGKQGTDKIERALNAWNAGTSFPGSMLLQGALTALGLPGTLPQYIQSPSHFKEFFDRGLQDIQMQRMVRDVYLISQAVLRLQSTKELHLYRGFRTTWEHANERGIKQGAVIKLQTRVLSSWTTSQGIAHTFARMHDTDAGPIAVVVEATVPASAVFLVAELVGGDAYKQNEAEYIVLGSRRARVVGVVH
jgi:hypothetical protein